MQGPRTGKGEENLDSVFRRQGKRSWRAGEKKGALFSWGERGKGDDCREGLRRVRGKRKGGERVKITCQERQERKK